MLVGWLHAILKNYHIEYVVDNSIQSRWYITGNSIVPFLESRDFNMYHHFKETNHSDPRSAILGKLNDCIRKAILDLTKLLGTRKSYITFNFQLNVTLKQQGGQSVL